MKRILFLFAGLVALSTNAFGTNNVSSETEISSHHRITDYGNSFIFSEGGIEFSVFPDGQFDFFMPNYGPNVSIGVNRPGFNMSFNSGYDYNPYLQYDNFGAIIQIENTPVYYDYYGRVNQIGNIFINYNRLGNITSIGGLNIYYRNNRFFRYDGFINNFNRRYVFRPWHQFYSVPAVNFCIVNRNPYRQFYRPTRYVYYRPYRNNVRDFNINRRRTNRSNNATRYAQTPRNERERNIQRRVTRSFETIATTRATRGDSTNSVTGRTNSTSRNNGITTRSTTPRNNSVDNTGQIRNNTFVNRSSRNNSNTNVTTSRNTVSDNRLATQTRNPKVNTSRSYVAGSQNKNTTAAVKTRSKTSSNSTQNATRSSSRSSRN